MLRVRQVCRRALRKKQSRHGGTTASIDGVDLGVSPDHWYQAGHKIVDQVLLQNFFANTTAWNLDPPSRKRGGRFGFHPAGRKRSLFPAAPRRDASLDRALNGARLA